MIYMRALLLIINLTEDQEGVASTVLQIDPTGQLSSIEAGEFDYCCMAPCPAATSSL